MYRVFTNYYKSCGLTQEDIARFLDRKVAYISLRLTGKQPFTLEDIYIICEKMEIPYEQIPYYFPKGGKAEFSEKYKKVLDEKTKSKNPFSFADELINIGKAIKKIEQSHLRDNVSALFD